MRGLFALMLASCFLNLVGSDLRAEEAPKPNPSKLIVFLNRAGFHCGHGLPTSPGGRPPVLIYPDMTIEFDSQGNYSVSFAVESPQSDVLLNLELLIPYSLLDESSKPSELVEGPPPAPTLTANEPKIEQSEALVVVPPIRIPSNKGEKVSETTQYFIKQVWARGNSAALARAYPKGKQTTFVPISDKPSADLPRRSGTATAGTIVK